ncbi:MAG: sugar phosphate isomerase, partial [Methanosarcinaceae archaeon]|nr:sugar phosphate isomerase [Methanosarcinaceae archaeon]
MKELMSLSTCKTEMDVFDSDWAMVGNFLTRHQLDGIELYVDHFPLPEVPADLIVGVHLPYWMGRHRAWLDDSVFCSDLEDAEKIFLFGGLSRGELLANFRKAMQNAKFLDAAYGVFHVAYVELENVFTRSFNCT